MKPRLIGRWTLQTSPLMDFHKYNIWWTQLNDLNSYYDAFIQIVKVSKTFCYFLRPMIISLYFWPTVDIDHKTSYIFPTTTNKKGEDVTILVSAETYEFINVMHISIEGSLYWIKCSTHHVIQLVTMTLFLSDYVSCSTLKDKLKQIVKGDVHAEETFMGLLLKSLLTSATVQELEYKNIWLFVYVLDLGQKGVV